MLAIGETRGHFAYEAALIYAVPGDLDVGFALLNKARRQRSGYMGYIFVDPRLDVLRADPRFATFVRSVGLQMADVA